MSQYESNDNRQEESFAALWEQMGDTYAYVSPQRGDVREGVILSVRPDEILIDIGAKQDAAVPYRELQNMTPEELSSLKVGDTVYVYVLRVDDRQDSLLVSLKLAEEYKDWKRAQDMLESGEIVTCEMTGYNKGGLVCTFGALQGFVPASQVVSLPQRGRNDTQFDALAQLVGQKLPVKVIEVNRRRRRLILSERAAQREWRAHQRERLLDELQVGDVRTGVVSNLSDFGAFVDLGGIDGLIHLSELSWSRVNHPREVLQVGQQIEVEVLNIDREKQRIGLSLKRTRPDPWSVVTERYQVGQLVKGRVTHLVDFGAFVELEPGVEGLVHVSELAEGNITNPSAVVSEGEELTLRVLSVEPERHRISLSLRQVPAELAVGRGDTIIQAQNGGESEPPADEEAEAEADR